MPSSNDVDGEVLSEPLSIGDLLSTGKEFEINSSASNYDGFRSDMYDDFGFGSSDEEGPEVDPKLLISPWQEPFEKLRSTMVKINDLIFKRVVLEGNKESKIVPDRARVSIQYTSYAEDSSKTFDSTYLRGKPHTFHTGNHEVLPGIEEAVKTMKLEEESQFIISYKLLYGELGCPPRIPPKKDYLFVIKVLSFEEVGDLDAMREVAAQDKKKFKIVFPKVREIHKKGIDFFKLNNYQGALKAFHKAVNCLIVCRLNDESEQKEYDEFMVKLYTNLATIYSILDKPAKVCSMCNEMIAISPRLYRSNAKALYREGKAFSDLGEYDRAHNKLMEAKRLCPTNEDIILELEKLNTRKTEYMKQNQEICARAFGLLNINKKKETVSEEDIFTQDMRETLNAFKEDDSLKEIHLPDGLSAHEVECVEKLVIEMGMKLSTATLTKKKVIIKI
ncbi:inactive peptidyl-prolyl cis-trans isomerase shutdown [Condylostylus longicornis]|uniref:inactive peptidyl-prolyl cis-trans isomerase shutdown n=1 Tax=Condylostylus longicornis TaxID=2530218 RepID=UPI00244DFAAC|nr:inactive peptidyl-prolyl cis-trans isomerase shutdown [Condylostylus longicornis]